MKQRCYQATYHNFNRYGGRGITVCDRWLKSFENFILDVGRKPSSRHSLDRIDNDKNYEPENVRWATPREQGNNRATCVVLTAFEKTMTLTEWSKLTGLGDRTIAWRLKQGWGVERALTQVKHLNRQSKLTQQNKKDKENEQS